VIFDDIRVPDVNRYRDSDRANNSLNDMFRLVDEIIHNVLVDRGP